MKQFNLKVKKSLDAVLIFSDMWFNESPGEIKNVIKKWKAKMIYVAVGITDSYMDKLRAADAGVKQKIVLVDPE